MAGGPSFSYTAKGKLPVNGERRVVDQAYRPGALQTDKSRGVGNLKRRSTNEAAAARAPINLPSWGHLAQLRDIYRFRRESRHFTMAKADHADAYKRLPLAAEAELAAVASLRNPGGRLLFGFVPRRSFAVSPQLRRITAACRA